MLLEVEDGVFGPRSSSSFSSRSTGCAAPLWEEEVGVDAVSCRAAFFCDRSSSSVEIAKRGMSIRVEQRLRTVSGGLESLSVWDDSEAERRFRRLKREEKEGDCGSDYRKRRGNTCVRLPAGSA